MLDSCTGHTAHFNDLQDHIKVIFFSSNTTSLIKPMHQDVVCCSQSEHLELTSAELIRAVNRDPSLGAKEYWTKFKTMDCVQFHEEKLEFDNTVNIKQRLKEPVARGGVRFLWHQQQGRG